VLSSYPTAWGCTHRLVFTAGGQARCCLPSPVPTPGSLPSLQGRTRTTGPRCPGTHGQTEGRGCVEEEVGKPTGEVGIRRILQSPLGWLCLAGHSAEESLSCWDNARGTARPRGIPLASDLPGQRELTFLKTSGPEALWAPRGLNLSVFLPPCTLLAGVPKPLPF
jgi:hypothetical protein